MINRVLLVAGLAFVMGCGGSKAGDGKSGNDDSSSKLMAPRFTRYKDSVDIQDPAKGLSFEGECDRRVDRVEIYSLYIPEVTLAPEPLFQYYDFDCQTDGFFIFIARKSDLVSAGVVPGSTAKIGFRFFSGSRLSGTLDFNY